MKKYYTLILTVFAASLIALNSYAKEVKTMSEDVLYSFDTTKMGSGNMAIKIEEHENHGNYSLIREEVYKRGSYAGAIMFSLCSSSVIAKKRGYSHFATLSSKDYEGCESCEMSWDTTLGFLNNVPDDLVNSPGDEIETKVEKRLRLKKSQQYLNQVFPQEIITEKDIEITSINDFWLICRDVRKICSW